MTPAHNAPRLLVEPFCGMAALSFGCMGAKPPISWMGGKAGYIRVLMELLGLSRHHPPAAYIWGDVGPNVAALACLSGAGGDARDVAGWLTTCRRSWKGQPECGFLPRETIIGPKSHAGDWRYAPDAPAEDVAPLPLPRAAEVAAIIRGWKDEEPRALWTRLKAAGWPSLMPVEGGRWLGPQSVEEVAGWFASSELAARGDPAAGYAGEQERYDAGKCWTKPNIRGVADAIDTLPARWPRVACYQGTATWLVEQLTERLDNVIAYLDPPYSGTTGYKFGDCPREEVLRLALDLHGRGATVAISEAVRLDRELGEGWHAVQIDGERRGQKRTFSVQQHEWVTMNRRPAQVPGQQQGLFGGAR